MTIAINTQITFKSDVDLLITYNHGIDYIFSNNH